MALDNSLRIRVGASLDANVRSVYKPLIEITKSAAKEVLAIWQQLSKDIFGAFDGSVGKVRVSTQKVGQDHVAMARVTGNSLQEIKAKYEELAESARQGLDLKSLASAAEADLARVSRAAAKAQLGIGGGGDGGGIAKYASRTGYWSMIYADRALRTGVGFAQSVARGAGLDFNLGSMVQSVSQQQLLATEISNEAFMPHGDVAANRTRIAGGDIRKGTNEVADQWGYDRSDTLGALQAFVGRTGDLQAGRESLGTMAKLARATGSDMHDMVSASADFSNVLGDIPNKGKEIEHVMMAIAGQSKTGAVSIRDLPNSMVKLTAQARNFTMDPQTRAIFQAQGITTSVGMAVASMGVLAQAAKQRGGATSAGVATNDAMSFIRDASSHAEMKRWSDAGLNVFADKGHTMIRDPKQLILEALRYSQGDLGKLSNLFPNKSSRAVAMAFTGSYKDAGGGQAGLEAASHQYDLLARSSMGQGELDDSAKAAMVETIPQVQIFKNHLQDTAEKISGKLIPAFEKMEPTVLMLTERFGSMVAWATENPGKAITGAIVASIARASVENAFRAGIEASIKGALSGGGSASKGFWGGGAGSNVLAGLSIASVAITTATIGMAVIDEWSKKANDENRNEVVRSLSVENDRRGVGFNPDGTVRMLTPEEQRKRLEADKDPLLKKGAELYSAKSLADQMAAANPGAEDLARDARKADKAYDENQRTLNSIDTSLRVIAAHTANLQPDGPGVPWKIPMAAPTPGGPFNVTDMSDDGNGGAP